MLALIHPLRNVTAHPSSSQNVIFISSIIWKIVATIIDSLIDKFEKPKIAALNSSSTPARQSKGGSDERVLSMHKIYVYYAGITSLAFGLPSRLNSHRS